MLLQHRNQEKGKHQILCRVKEKKKERKKYSMTYIKPSNSYYNLMILGN